MKENEFKEFFAKYPAVAEFFGKNKRALLQFCECCDCKLFHFYKKDAVPYGKCTHPKRPKMQIQCEHKKRRYDGERYGIKIPDLKK